MERRPRLVDLFCGAGGAAAGYHRAGFEVIGVDSVKQPHYPFAFVLADAMSVDLEGFDAIHASPPCQAYSVLSRDGRRGRTYPDLLAAVRDRLDEAGRPYVIENVPGSPIRGSLMLCGSSFGLGTGGRQLRRHRYFELNFPLRTLVPPCQHEGESIGVYGQGPTDNNKHSPGRRGGYTGTAAEKAAAMGIDWMNRNELGQAIPPAYTAFIGEQILEELRAEAELPQRLLVK